MWNSYCLFPPNRCDWLCATLTGLCMITVATSKTLEQYNERTSGCIREFGIFRQERANGVCLTSVQMMTALGGQRTVKQAMRRNRSMLCYNTINISIPSALSSILPRKRMMVALMRPASERMFSGLYSNCPILPNAILEIWQKVFYTIWPSVKLG